MAVSDDSSRALFAERRRQLLDVEFFDVNKLDIVYVSLLQDRNSITNRYPWNVFNKLGARVTKMAWGKSETEAEES